MGIKKAKQNSIRKKAGRWLRKSTIPIIAFILFVTVWELICLIFNVGEYLVPRPSRVFLAITQHWEILLNDTWITTVEAFLGFMLANILSILTAILFTLSKGAKQALYPYIIAVKAIPIIAIAPLLVIWFGYGIFGKVVMAAIISFFPLVVNATVGLAAVEPEALTLMRSLSATKVDILFKLRLPNAVPYIFSALKISSSLAVVGAIVAELTGAKVGLGFRILMASYNIDTPLLFAAIIFASLIGVLSFALIELLEITAAKKYIRRN